MKHILLKLLFFGSLIFFVTFFLIFFGTIGGSTKSYLRGDSGNIIFSLFVITGFIVPILGIIVFSIGISNFIVDYPKIVIPSFYIIMGIISFVVGILYWFFYLGLVVDCWPYGCSFGL